MDPVESGNWSAGWVWSLPLVVLNTVVHVIGLGIVSERVVQLLEGWRRHRQFMSLLAVGMGLTVVLATGLHWFEAAIRAGAFRLLGALPDIKSAILYSLSAMTTYGHANLFLKGHRQIMGAIEALNGMLLFGLTTAFLFAMIHKVWPPRNWE